MRGMLCGNWELEACCSRAAEMHRDQSHVSWLCRPWREWERSQTEYYGPKGAVLERLCVKVHSPNFTRRTPRLADRRGFKVTHGFVLHRIAYFNWAAENFAVFDIRLAAYHERLHHDSPLTPFQAKLVFLDLETPRSTLATAL